MSVIARVQPLTRTRAVRGPFDYRIDVAHGPVGVGSVLRVPFGGRRTLGVVVAMAEESEVAPDRLAAPDEVLSASVPADLVALGGWMAAEYCSTEARALSLVLAPGTAEGVRARLVLVAELTAEGRSALGDAGPAINDAQRVLLQRLRDDGPAVAAGLGTPALRRLERRGLVALDTRIQPRRPLQRPLGHAEAVAPALTADQADVLAPILDALGAVDGPPAEPVPFLLHGVTGSGKTEVYLRAVRAALEAGRTAIVLVPEIALTPQVLWRFQVRFGDVVAVLHSALGAGERHDEWLRLRDGQARVCVGPRSAIFAPLPDLGLIIVDEEHESSYKHEGDPRYDARSVALERARASGAVLIAGSATPRPESIRSMTRLRLPRRVDHRPMPHVEVLDMRGARAPLHPETRMALSDLRRAGGKAVVLLNRRGWSNFLSCRSCGHVWLCPDCEVALVLHRHNGFVACHHCGHRERVPERCGECGSVTVARHGAGTERIEHELREALGADDFPVFRLDADAATLDRRAGILETFARAAAGVLVGTQMVAKGHDFPDVTLGVVLDADQTLRFPDFRAEERTFALITQLAGRTGRGRGAGRVLVQTLAPGARAIDFATRHDSDGFTTDELHRREILRYPPYATLIRVICSAVEEPPAREAAAEIARRLPADGPTVLGPAPLFRLRGRARSQLVIKADDRPAAIAAVGAAVDAVAPGVARRGVNVSVDVDPQ